MIPLIKTNLPPREVLMPALERVLYSGYVAQGDEVDLFERAFEKYIGGGHSLSLNSGTAALHVALILAGVSAGDEVISTAMTAEPTNVAIKMMGAKICYADIDPDTGNISPSSIEANICSDTRAIVVVDYAGVPVNVSEISKISKKYNIPVIHDAAHSLGAKFEDLKMGNHFPYTIFSFQAIKHITTIDGGILHISSSEDYEKAKLIRWFGLDKRLNRLDNNIQIQGYKYHMNNVNATIGLIQLHNVDSVIQAHIENGKYFDRELQGISGIELLKYYPKTEPSYWLYTIKVKNRENLINHLALNGIIASVLHQRSDHHEYLRGVNQKLPFLDVFYSQLLHLPCGWWVSERDREYIVRTIKRGW